MVTELRFLTQLLSQFQILGNWGSLKGQKGVKTGQNRSKTSYFVNICWVRNRSSVTILCEGFFSVDSCSRWKNRKNEPLCRSQKFGEKFLWQFLEFQVFQQISSKSINYVKLIYSHIIHHCIRNFILSNYFDEAKANIEYFHIFRPF